MKTVRTLVLAALASGLCVPTLALSAAAAAEFRVNTFKTDDQSSPSVAALSGGGFVVVWTSKGQDGTGYGIYGQRYAANGVKAGIEFRVNTFTAYDQLEPSVAGLSGGGFVVVWSSGEQDGSSYGIYGQRYGAGGAKAGVEFRINSFRAGTQAEPAVAALLNDTFVVVWSSQNQDGSGYGVFAQRYAASGAKAGAPFQVNTNTSDDQTQGAVARFGSGSAFVVVWSSRSQDGDSRGVYAQLFNAAGANTGAEFRVNAQTKGSQSRAAVGRLKSGRFVVSFSSESGSSEVLVQRFTVAGAKFGAQVRANTFSTNDQSYSSIAGTAGGDFVVTWTSFNQDGSGTGIYGQRYAADGARKGGEFRANETTDLAQELSSVAPWSTNGFVVVWRSADQDTSGFAVIGRRFPN